MKIAVCIKQAIDVSQLRVDPTTRKPVITGVPRKMSDIDRNAVEEAVRIKEKHGGKITAITFGSEKAREVLREALAMGVDEGVLILNEKLENADTYITSEILAAALNKYGPFNLILCGEATIDSYSGQVGPRIAEILNIPCVTYVRAIQIADEKVIVERDLEEKYEKVEVNLPALLVVTREINVPRLPPLMAILRASKKPIEKITLNDLKIDVKEPAVEILDVYAPEMKRKMHIIKDKPIDEAVQELIELLVKEGVLGG
ncbi:MAG: electron transfer flavoprotein subunit beta/FixA family protein [archaeon GB-1867-035]|nr:electron transfer flavoprotein subunit beta/FixA family protein [Candidatus Culexmicrobium profundum]